MDFYKAKNSIEPHLKMLESRCGVKKNGEGKSIGLFHILDLCSIALTVFTKHFMINKPLNSRVFCNRTNLCKVVE